MASTSLTCYCSSVPPISRVFFSYERFCFCFPSRPKPLLLLGWFLNGGIALPPTTATTTAVRWQGTPPVGRRARTTRMTPSNYVSTTLLFEAHSSCWLLVSPVGRRTPTTQTTPSQYVRTTLLFGSHSSSRILVASSYRQLVIYRSAVELPKPHPSDVFAPRSANMLHSTSPRVASTSPKIGHRLVLYLRFGAPRHVCTTRHGQTYWNQPLE